MPGRKKVSFVDHGPHSIHLVRRLELTSLHFCCRVAVCDRSLQFEHHTHCTYAALLACHTVQYHIKIQIMNRKHSQKSLPLSLSKDDLLGTLKYKWKKLPFSMCIKRPTVSAYLAPTPPDQLLPPMLNMLTLQQCS